MSPRSWVALCALVVAVLLNAVLLWRERRLPPRPSAAVAVEHAPLRALVYAAPNRRRNLMVMGFPPRWADQVARRVHALADGTERWEQRLADGGAAAVRGFCPGELPQPYGALEVLVAASPAGRVNVDGDAPLRAQAWFAASEIPGLHRRFEQSDHRAFDATLAAVSAVFEARETTAARRGSVAVPDPDSEQGRAIAEYFARMHLLTELANRPGGICDAG